MRRVVENPCVADGFHYLDGELVQIGSDEREPTDYDDIEVVERMCNSDPRYGSGRVVTNSIRRTCPRRSGRWLGERSRGHCVDEEFRGRELVPTEVLFLTPGPADGVEYAEIIRIK